MFAWIIVYLAVISTVSADSDRNAIAITGDCLSKHPISIEQFNKLTFREVPHDGAHIDCFLACVLDNVGLFEDGSLVKAEDLKDGVKERLGVQDFGYIVDFLTSCNNVNITDEPNGCVRARLAIECWFENFGEMGLNFEALEPIVPKSQE
ncbi:uncharacterized protein LOC113495865 [Trichoplusia ni]|uniref:Uncharacterized protein LOC113495865 n=1 Tax=Trichoplusia ni TaxID=7111 RepID=A0A7E5VQW1_TRINI|nr:uncharacterized protein LOC113495865 [Trichoplusia ni]